LWKVATTVVRGEAQGGVGALWYQHQGEVRGTTTDVEGEKRPLATPAELRPFAAKK